MVLAKLRKPITKNTENKLFKNASTEKIFTHIYIRNKWGDTESRSGKGSNLDRTSSLMHALPALRTQLKAETMLDIPCGDFHWMKEVKLPLRKHLGADTVKSLINDNQRRYGNKQRNFVHLDLMRDSLPEVDVIFCRNCLVHLSFADISMAIENVRKSGAEYFITTHFPQVSFNKDCITGKHQAFNFNIESFNWPNPMLGQLEYNAGKRRGDKYLSV